MWTRRLPLMIISGPILALRLALGSVVMSISEKTIKLLWANAAGRCAFPDCGALLCTPESGSAAPYTIGEMAHIRGEKPGASRHDAGQTAKERNSYANLILLCPTHHTLIDKPENETSYSVNLLLN